VQEAHAFYNQFLSQFKNQLHDWFNFIKLPEAASQSTKFNILSAIDATLESNRKNFYLFND
jgi:hypothetical protein